MNKQRNFFILFIGFSFFIKAQVIPIYKIDTLLKRIKSNNDTTYIVNFWATWCKPCVEELPEFEKLNAKKDSIGGKIKVLLVTLDFKDQLKKRVKPFVRSKKIQSEVVLLDEVNGNDFIDKINKSWSGAIPATLIVRNGSQIFHEGKVTFVGLIELISKLKT